VLFFWFVIVALFALIDIFLLSYNAIKINQDKQAQCNANEQQT
jgi:hypothetical protein